MGGLKVIPPGLATRRLLYLVTPNETSFETVEEVPNYVNDSVPYFFVFIILEAIIRLIQKRETFRCNDLFSSVSAGVLSESSKVLFRSVEFSAYLWTYKNIRVITLPWDEPLTWWICFFGVDLGYYWFHRAAHEVNVIWAAHQVHHSSEDYNLSTALRQSTVQVYTSWLFYIPLAFGIPPPMFLVHQQFNLIYQFWIHTELVDTLGPLEYILNTPSHHRVHHGRNPYCIDKNYGGTLIIWDRLFGTFQAEGEVVAYGLTHPLNTWDPMWTQMCHYVHIIRTCSTLSGLRQRLGAVFNGPGWTPGKPRLGDPHDIPKIEYPVTRYNPHVTLWITVYVASHFLITVMGYQILFAYKTELSLPMVIAFISYIIYSLTCFGALFDNKPYASLLEICRCAIYISVDGYLLHIDWYARSSNMMLTVLQAYFIVSITIWLMHSVKMKVK